MGWARRSGRIAKEIRILLFGTDTAGRVFSEETRTVTLSRHGAGLISKHKLAPDGTVTLRFLGGSTEAAIRLVGQLGEDARGYVYGVAFVDPKLDFWELTFPPPTKWQVDFEAPLQCISCKTFEIVDQSEVEADAYALSQSILRFCLKCGISTQWRRATFDAFQGNQSAPGRPELPAASPETPSARSSEPDSLSSKTSRAAWGQPVLVQRSSLSGIEIAISDAPPPAPLPPAASAAVARGSNRRRDVRTRVSFTACMRYDGAEEIVECGNISKGGLSFRSRKAYPAGAEIGAAVPFYPGSQPVFVAATIRHVDALPIHNYHYGVMYTPTKKPESKS